MKRNKKYIQLLLLAVFAVFLYGFSGHRNARRRIGKLHISFTNAKTLFITKKAVNNLLITKPEQFVKQSKDSLDLKDWEHKLNRNPMIANAEVFEKINGDLGIVITQRQPLGRILGKKSYYIDKHGGIMPLSKFYTARVPLITGIDSVDAARVFPLLQKIENDKFLKRRITGIDCRSNGDFILRLRDSPLKINFGFNRRMNEKIRNFKAFYKRETTLGKLENYTMVNLKFAHQVVCTKK